MEQDNIEIQIIHTHAMMENDSFGIRVLINNEDSSVLELSENKVIKIINILLNVIKTFIKHLKDYGQTTGKT